MSQHGVVCWCDRSFVSGEAVEQQAGQLEEGVKMEDGRLYEVMQIEVRDAELRSMFLKVLVETDELQMFCLLKK